MKIIRVGVDLAKSVFQVHGVDRSEKVVWRKKLGRAEWLAALLEKIEPGCEIGMEACGGAHHWARQLQMRGYTVKLIAPQFVKPYVKSNKNDANDAEAICEAMSRPNMRFVAVKSVEQQDLQAIHRIRAELCSQRTAKGNQIRGLCAEYGLVAPREMIQLRAAVPCWIDELDNGLTIRFRRLLRGLWLDLMKLELRVKESRWRRQPTRSPPGCSSCAASVPSSPRRSWPMSAMRSSSAVAGRWLRRSGSRPGRTAQAARSDCWGLRNGVTRTCERC